MKWNRSLLVVILLGITVLAMAGCGKAEETVPATEQPAPTTSLPPEGTMPAPPEGIAPGERPSALAMDLAAAAAKLGVTEQQLSEALGESGQRPADFAAAAQKLGITEEALREALGLPEGAPPAGSPTPGGLPPSGNP